MASAGIYHIITYFTPDRIITAMESAEKEIVEFSRTIDPHLAKGLVEKWLQQV